MKQAIDMSEQLPVAMESYKLLETAGQRSKVEHTISKMWVCVGVLGRTPRYALGMVPRSSVDLVA